MQVELYCPHCSCCFSANPEAPAAEVLDRMADEGPWYALGDGETFEDMIFSTLFALGARGKDAQVAWRDAHLVANAAEASAEFARAAALTRNLRERQFLLDRAGRSLRGEPPAG